MFSLEMIKDCKIRGEKKLYDVSFLFHDVGFPNIININPRDDYNFNKIMQMIYDGELPKVCKYVRENETRINPIDLHYIYTGLQEAFYRKRDEDFDNLDKCKIICEMDIALLECNIIDLELAYIPSLNRLINILENEGEFDKARQLCIFGGQRYYESKMIDGWSGRIKSIERRRQDYESSRKDFTKNC